MLLVSHDRAFLDNVVTSTLVFEGNAQVKEYVGGYDDWLRQYQHASKTETKQVVEKKKTTKATEKKQTKLSYKDQRELDVLPQKIETLETKIELLNKNMSSPEFYQQESNVIASKQNELEELQKELAQAYERWDHLEGLITSNQNSV